MHVLLIANPVAGRGALRHIERARTTLERFGAEVTLHLTTAAGDAERRAEQARQEPFDRVVAAGGDGTLNEVVNGLAGCTTPLAFIPLGTTNVFALEARIPLDVEAAATLAVQEAPRAVTLGRAGTRYFLLMAGIGFDGGVVAGVSQHLKRLLGKGAYLVAALQQLVSRPPRLFEVRCAGEPRQAAGVLLANARCYGGRFTLTRRANLESPDLEACLLGRPGRLALLRQALCLVSGRPMAKGLGCVTSLTALEVTTPGLPVQIDGDYLGETPMTFSCVTGALQLVMPRHAGEQP